MSDIVVTIRIFLKGGYADGVIFSIEFAATRKMLLPEIDDYRQVKAEDGGWMHTTDGAIVYEYES